MSTFNRQVVEAALSKLRGMMEATPTRTAGGGHVYKELEELGLGVDIDQLLRYLESEGLIAKTFVDNALNCPKCSHEGHKPNLFSTPACEKCSSRQLVRDRLIEHKLGGHIHPESRFREKGEGLICPSCGKELKNRSEYSVIGTWFNCRGCQARYEKLPIRFRCLTCGLDFTPEDAVIDALYKYTLTAKATEYLKTTKDMVIEILIRTLSGEGNIKKSHFIAGKSGVTHTFDVMLDNGKQPLLFDIAFSETDVDEVPIMKSFTKSMDTEAKRSILVVWPRLSASARSLAGFYKIEFVEAKDEGEIHSRITSLLQVKEATPSKAK